MSFRDREETDNGRIDEVARGWRRRVDDGRKSEEWMMERLAAIMS